MWPATRYTNQAEFSPDGKRVLFVSQPGWRIRHLHPRPSTGHARSSRCPTASSTCGRTGRSMAARSMRSARAAARTARACSRASASRWETAASRCSPRWATPCSMSARPIRAARLIVGEIVGNAARILRTPWRSTGCGRAVAAAQRDRVSSGGRGSSPTSSRSFPASLCAICPTLACAPVAVAIDESNQFDCCSRGMPSGIAPIRPPAEVVRYDLARGAITWRGGFAPTALGLSLAVRPRRQRAAGGARSGSRYRSDDRAERSLNNAARGVIASK